MFYLFEGDGRQKTLVFKIFTFLFFIFFSFMQIKLNHRKMSFTKISAVVDLLIT